MFRPRVEALEESLREWGEATKGALRDMIRDIDDGRLEDDTMQRDFDFIRVQMRRHEVLTTAIRPFRSVHGRREARP